MFTEVNGVRIHYEIEGEGPVLIMVHGNGEDMSIFDVAAGILSERFTVCLVDSRGHGLSGPVDEFHYEDMAEDMHRLIAALGFDRPAFYGYSDGGIVGLLLASEHPEDVSRLIVSGANTDPSTVMWESWEMDLIDREDPKVRMMLEEPHITAEDLAKIRVPTLVIVGDHDAILPSDTQFIVDSIPDACLVTVVGADHGSYIEHSPVLPGIILDWFD